MDDSAHKHYTALFM